MARLTRGELAELVLRHLRELSNDHCSIADDDIRKEADEDVAAILTGLLYLHEDYQLQRKRLRRVFVERTVAEDALAQGKERYQLALEGTSDGIFDWDLLEGRTYYSMTFRQLLGHDEVSTLPACPFDEGWFVTNPESRGLLEARLADGGLIRMESSLRLASGARRWFQVRGRARMRDGKPVRFVGSIRDIDEQVEARAEVRDALDRSEQYNRAIIQALPDMLVRIGRDGTFLDFYAGDSHFDPQRVIGKTLWEVLPRATADQSRDAIHATLDEGTVTPIEYNVELGGRLRAYEARMTVYRENEVLTILRDVTEQRAMEQKMLEAQRMEAVGLLAGGISHDFNNVLTTILATASMLREDLAESDLREDVDAIINSAMRAAQLTSQLLAFSRKQVQKLEVININELLRRLEKMLRRLLGEHIAIETLLDPNLWAVNMDPSQLERVVLNLSLNARDAMPNGGRLTVSTSNLISEEGNEPDEHPPLAPGRYVVLTVCDTGTGIDEPTRARIFEPFFTTKDVGKGTGLGLSSVYGIVKQSHGEVTVQSEGGQGARFTVYLPASDRRPSSISNSDAPSRQVRRKTLLLVEDEEMIRTVSKRILERQGYEVLTAACPSEAIKIAKEHAGEIQLLLTDVIMPEMSGPQLVRQLLPIRPHLRVAYMSGYSRDKIAQDGVPRRNTILIEKPFTPRELLRAIDKMIDRPADEAP